MPKPNELNKSSDLLMRTPNKSRAHWLFFLHDTNPRFFGPPETDGYRVVLMNNNKYLSFQHSEDTGIRSSIESITDIEQTWSEMNEFDQMLTFTAENLMKHYNIDLPYLKKCDANTMRDVFGRITAIIYEYLQLELIDHDEARNILKQTISTYVWCLRNIILHTDQNIKSNHERLLDAIGTEHIIATFGPSDGFIQLSLFSDPLVLCLFKLYDVQLVIERSATILNVLIPLESTKASLTQNKLMDAVTDKSQIPKTDKTITIRIKNVSDINSNFAKIISLGFCDYLIVHVDEDDSLQQLIDKWNSPDKYLKHRFTEPYIKLSTMVKKNVFFEKANNQTSYDFVATSLREGNSNRA